ncbi:MAG: SRPBCC domain-containing protein [Candidatus Nitrosopolaris sp.]|jgi:uncharacterized protein YndB with AHSA1/START domain
MSTTERKGQKGEEETIEIKKSIVIDASPEVVFKAITDPNELTNWFPDHAILEPKVGGKMKLSFYKEKSENDHPCTGDASPEGTIKEFIPNKKLSYTWQHKDVPEFPETVVSWELEDIGANKTRVELIHSGFTGKEERKSFKEHDQGWTYFLDRLEKYCKDKK